MTRLDPRPGERIDRARTVTFTFDGKPVEAFAGDTIASALYAGGRRIFSRSFKYHRPRGEMDWAGQGANSLVQIDGAPGIRAASEVVREGMVVEHQNAWPSLDFDVMRMSDIAGGPFTPPGFYYKTFKWPRRAWPLYERALRGVAGLGRLPERQDDRLWRTEYRRRHCDVLVIGGGIAGLSAAIAAARQGADVVLADDDVEPGGALLAEGGHERVRALADEARAAGVEVLSKAPALGFYDGLVPIWQGDTLHQVRAKRHVAATGAIEQPLVFKDNDLPGVMMTGGARRLAELWAVRPGTTAVIATTGDRGLDAALALREAGVEIAAIADLRPDAADRELGAAVQAAGIRLLAGMTVVRALGRNGVAGAVLARVDPSGKATGTLEEVACDLLAVSGGTAPATSLLLQSGAKARYDAATSRFLAELGDGIVHAAGAVAGHEDADAAACLRDRRGPRRRRGARPGRRERQARADERAQAPRRAPAAVPGRGPARLRARRPPRREGVRRPRRGHHGEGHRLLRGRGLRLDRAVQALHDRDDGPLAGAPLAARLDPRPRRGDGAVAGRRRHHDGAPALVDRPDGRARRPPVRAGQALGDPRPPPRAGREREVGGRLAPRLRLRRPRGRGEGGPRRRRPHRRLHPRQAARPRARRRRVPRPALPQPRLEPEARAHPLRRADERDGPHHRRRHHRAPRRRDVLRHDDLQRRRGGPQLVHVVARRLAHARPHHRRHAGLGGDEPRGAALARDPAVADRRRPVGGGHDLPRRAARAGRGRVVPRPADRLHRRAGLRDPLPGAARAGPLGRGHAGGRRARHPPVRPGAAAHPAPPEAPHPRRAGHGLGVDAVRRRHAVDRQARQGGGLHRALGARARRGASGLHRARRLQPPRRRRARPRAPRSSTRAARRSARSPARATAARSARSSAWPGCRPRRPRTARR